MQNTMARRRSTPHPIHLHSKTGGPNLPVFVGRHTHAAPRARLEVDHLPAAALASLKGEKDQDCPAGTAPNTRMNKILISTAVGSSAALSTATLFHPAHSLFASNYLPHRFCYLASPPLIWTNVAADATIAVSYILIFGSLGWIAAHLRQVRGFRTYLWVLVSFALFIIACAATHAMEIATIWWPAYPLSAAVKLLCAAISLPTAILFTRFAPRLNRNLRQYLQIIDITRNRLDQSLLALQESKRLVAECLLAQEALHEANIHLASFRIMIDAVVDYAIFMIDLEGKIVTWNTGAQRIKGYTTEQAIGRHFSIFYPQVAIDSHLPERELEIALAQGHYEDEGWRIRRDGSRLWASITITALRDSEGTLIGFGKVTRDLTERRAAEDALRESSERHTRSAAALATTNNYLNGILGASIFSAIIATDLQGTVTSFNSGAQRMLGYSEDEIVGRHTPALFHLAGEIQERGRALTGLLGRQIHGFAVFASSIGVPGYEQQEWTYVHKDGHHITVNLSLSAIQDSQGTTTGYLGVAQDVTERRRAQADLTYAHAQLNAVLESTSDSVMTISHDWTLLYGNSECRKQLADFATGRNHWESFPAVLGSLAEPLLRTAMAQRTETSYEVFYAPYEKWFKVRVFPTAEGLTAFFSSNTEEKNLQAQLELEQDLREKRIVALSHMAGGLAHEISNPLAIIHANASDLKAAASEGAEIPRADIIRACDSIVQTSDRAMRILRGLRGFARDGRKDPMEWASLHGILEECIDLQQPRHLRHQVELRSTIDPQIPAILCRETQIGQIVTNLLNNAFDAINQSQSTERWISVNAEHHGASIQIDVVDSGPGIDAEFRQHLMEPFFTTKSAGLGMGVGLSLSRAIAEDHKGSLTLCSDTVNTCFRLVLPIDPEADPQPLAASNSGSPS
jgi:PAS domain S-box-containing protein